MKRTFSLLTGVSLALGGCAHYAPAPLAASVPLAPSLAAVSSVPAGPLTVAQVVRLAVERDPDLVAARTKRGVAEAQIVQAGVLPNPTFSGAFLPLISGAGNVPAWSVGLAQDIKSLLVYRPKRRAARDSAAQVRADLLWQEWQVAGQARQLAVDIVERDRQRPVLVQAFDLLSRRYQVTQAALAAGNATLVTTAPSAVGFQQARANLQALGQAQLQARHKLNALLALAPDAVVPLAPTSDVAPLDPVAVRALLPSLPDRRPDLLALRLGYAAQDETFRAAILAQFPDLLLGGASSSDNSQVINAGPNVQLGLPIFDRNQGNVAIARATRAQLGAEYAARLATTTGEVGALLSELEQLRAQLAVVQRDLPAARLAAARASVAFGRSALDERAYVDLVTNRFTKEQEVLTLQLGLLDRQIAIEALIGAGLPAGGDAGSAEPGHAGGGAMRHLAAGVLALIPIIVLAGCGSSQPAAEATPTPTTQVGTIRPQRGSLPLLVESYGEAAPSANGVVTLSVAQPGQVTAVPVVAGARVAAGQPVVIFAVAPSARSTFEQAATTLKAAQQARATTAQLLTQQLATRDQLVQADKAVADARTALAALAKEGAGAASTTLRAPFAGVVATVPVAPGDRTQPGQALATVSRAQAVIVTVGVDPTASGRVRVGAPVTLRRLDNAAAPPITGRVVRVDAALNPKTRQVDGDIGYPAGALLTGEAMRVEIETGRAGGWVVPHAAVAIDASDHAQVFQIHSGKAFAVPVTVLASVGGADSVSGALDANAPLIVAGAYQVADGDAVRAIASTAIRSGHPR